MLTLLYIGLDAPLDLPDAEWHYATGLLGLVDRATKLQPSLVVLAMPDSDWKQFSAALKSSNATRRIPIVLIHNDVAQRASAALHGADYAISLEEWDHNPSKHIKERAHVHDPQMLVDLECQCEELLPPRGLEGIDKFNSGEYYQQHDLFEAQWMEETRPVRDLYRAILQVGIGYFHITNGNYRGALKTLQKSVQWLMMLPDTCQGVDVKQLREDSFAVRAELERLGAERIHEFDQTLLRPVIYNMA